ncbi:MAG: DSBA oxidoreductase [Candidatus Shapirobacteria bacterium GW2011_GWE1_38_10]|uniref:DSBA oxidoreductase n=1 Tax=Candidatus Shapirobacteria bacterium GW2011_GWE1_38_10 TaxID=1618488 RepID=A0A0G0IGX4_9BACT|nr:MAG: DSBA oxidoreductase [Candidatus Shapirobacteria bacterium GW2011_GWE1_38_10]
MSKETIIVLLLVVAAFFGGYYFSKSEGAKGTPTVATPTGAQQAVTEVTIDQVKALFNDKNIVFGDKNSKLLIAEFSDPSCPFCHVAAGTNSELNKEMGSQFILKADGGTYVAPEIEIKKLVDSGKAGFVWLYANGHGNGELATQALYCANESGKFWQVHDKLMTQEGYELINTTVKNDKTKSGVMADFLKGAIDSNTLKDCIDSEKYASRLAEDMATASQMGFEGTPYFILNTTRFAGAYSFTDMQSVVDEAI